MQHLLTEETAVLVDNLLGPWLQQQLGKNDMAIVSALLTASAILVRTHCDRTGHDFEDMRALALELFTASLQVIGDDRRR